VDKRSSANAPMITRALHRHRHAEDAGERQRAIEDLFNRSFGAS
jgi:hypothetical protein